MKLRFHGPIAELNPATRRALFDRLVDGVEEIRRSVRDIVADVRRRGDVALLEQAARFDQVKLERLEVPRSAWRRALDALAPEVRTALERAAANIERAHRAWQPTPTEVETEPGVWLCREPLPISRVGVYVPGGRAAYPSSVLMGVIPARVAGVPDVVICSPPGPNELPADPILAAAELAQASRVFAVGGAGAVAALAFGTESVPRVDKIVGPGNAYVMEAKLLVASRAGIDAPAGPSEVLIVADQTAALDVVALEMVAQAEHDPRAAVVAVLVGAPDRSAELIQTLDSILAGAGRAAIARDALAAAGGILSATYMDEAAAFANAYAPEHLLLMVADPDAARSRFRTAGAVFVGATSSVVFGDYLTGANHVLPTGGLARSYSGLSTPDFVRWTTFQRVSPEAARRLARDTAILAELEGLPGHALAARRWDGGATE